MPDEASRPMLRATNQRGWCGLVLGLALASGCATGVDVTDDELAEICSDPANRCSGGVAGAAVGSVGGSTGGGLGGGGSGGSFSSSGGSNTLPSNGGNSSANGGSLGSSGSGSSGSNSGSGGTGTLLPLAEGDCLDTDDIVVLYRDRTSAAASHNEPSMEMQVQNPAGTSFPLSDLAIRYWFTADGTSDFIGTVDYATVNNQGSLSGIVISFGQEFGSDYAEMTFPMATDMIGAQGISQLQLRFHATPYAALNQTNDFSFLSGATAMTTPNRNITPYLRNSQVGGCVPSAP